MADIANRIFSEAFGSNKSAQLASFVLLLIAFGVVVITAIVIDCKNICLDKKKNKNDNCRPSPIESTKFIIMLCTLFGGALYFVGDNLETAVNIEFVSLLSPALSISGVVLLRIFTRALRTLQKYCKEKQRLPDAFKLCSPNRNTETHALVVVYVHLLTFLIEFDTVLSIVLRRVDESNLSNSFCNSTKQKALVWSFYGCMITIFFITQVIIVGIFLMTACCPRNKVKKKLSVHSKTLNMQYI